MRMYVRSKKIKGRTYYYLVEGVKEGNTVKQKVIQYVGKDKPSEKQVQKIIREYSEMQPLTSEEEDALNRIKKEFQGEWKKKTRTEKEKYLESFMVDYTYNTNAIEGSTLTLRDTALILVDGIVPGDKPTKDVIEAKNMESCFNMIMNKKEEITPDFVAKLHMNLMHGISKDGGKIRKTQAYITGSKFKPPKPSKIKHMLLEFYKWINKNKKKTHPAILAALTHLKFVTIHPYSDGNGRISRLLMNKVLWDSGYPLITIKYRNRKSYYTSLEKSQLNENETTFIRYFKKTYIKQQKK